MKADAYLKEQLATGRYSFTVEEAEIALQRSRLATLAALERLARKGELVSPCRGFYLIVPAEYRLMGGLPPNEALPLLMAHLSLDYYVCLLSAAQHYGAAHYQPQTYQVMVAKNRPDMSWGRSKISFIVRKDVAQMPTALLKTPRGGLRISTPEATAMDLVSYPRRSGGLSAVALVLAELAEQISVEALHNLAKQSPQTLWVQRLGFLLEKIGQQEMADVLLNVLQSRNMYFKALASGQPIRGFPRNSKWKLIVNTLIEDDDL